MEYQGYNFFVLMVCESSLSNPFHHFLFIIGYFFYLSINCQFRFGVNSINKKDLNLKMKGLLIINENSKLSNVDIDAKIS